MKASTAADDVEQLHVAVSGQPGFEVIDLLRQHRLNHLRGDRLLADPEPFFECERQMPLDLQWCAQARDEQLDCSRCDQVTSLCTFGASLQQPSDVLTLLARDAVEGEQTGSIADFLHGRPAPNGSLSDRNQRRETTGANTSRTPYGVI
jgi:hypothetical protein